MGNLTDRINSILRELQEASETVNGVAPMPVQPSVRPSVSVMASKVEPNQSASGQTEKPDVYRASIMPVRDASPLDLPDYSGNPLVQGIILAEILGKPLSKRPRNRYRHI